MAFRNPFFNPQLEKHSEPTTEDYYENDKATPIYQQLAFPRPVKVDRPTASS